MSNTPPDRNATNEQRWAWLLDQLNPDMMNRLYREAYRILQNADDAKDAMQEAIVQSADNCWQLRDSSRFYAWMFTIVRREAYRIQKKSLQLFIHNIRQHTIFLSTSTTPEQQVISAETLENLRTELENLRSPEKEIVNLKITTSMNLNQIAAKLGLNYHTTRSKYTRTLHYLRKKLLEDNRHEKG